jgi:hypothetical protein
MKRFRRFTTAALMVFMGLAAAHAAGTPATGAERHAKNGVTCADCHGKTGKPQPVPMWKCVSCHGPTKDLAARTEQVQPTNPHQSRHFGTDADCNKCHHQHMKSENECGKCHKFNFQVP